MNVFHSDIDSPVTIIGVAVFYDLVIFQVGLTPQLFRCRIVDKRMQGEH